MMRKAGLVAPAQEALARVRDQAVVALSGFNLATTPEYLIHEIYRLYRRTGHPKGLFLIGDSLPAIPGRGLDAVAKGLYDGEDVEFLRGISVPFLGFSPYLQKMAVLP